MYTHYILFLRGQGIFPVRKIRVFKITVKKKSKMIASGIARAIGTYIANRRRIHRRAIACARQPSFSCKFISVISSCAERQCSPLASFLLFCFLCCCAKITIIN